MKPKNTGSGKTTGIGTKLSKTGPAKRPPALKPGQTTALGPAKRPALKPGQKTALGYWKKSK